MSLNYDITLGRAESLRYLNRCREQINQLKKTTHFNRDELQFIFLIHYKLISSLGPFNFHLFQEFCHTTLAITDDLHYERLFKLFDPKLRHYLSPKMWVRMLSIMLRAPLRDQIKLVWQVYSHDNFITKEFLSSCLKKTLIKKKRDSEYDLLVKDMATILQKKLDRDLDGRISWNDFEKSVLDNPLLLECLGQCLPKPEAASAFLATLSNRAIRVRVLPYSSRVPKRILAARNITFHDE